VTVALDDFFSQMAGLLTGEQTVEQCQAVLGHSPSGSERFAVYAKLVDRQFRGAIESFFRAALTACRAWENQTCAILLDEFMTSHRPHTWSPIDAALPLANFLQRRGVPDDINELADFACTRHTVLTTPRATSTEAIAIRSYTHDIAEFVRRVDEGTVTGERPAAKPTTIVLGRHLETSGLVLLYPSLSTLVALQLISDRRWTPDLPMVDKRDVASQAQFLAEQGIIAASDVELVAACVSE
jgi:hypothetical protein